MVEIGRPTDGARLYCADVGRGSTGKVSAALKPRPQINAESPNNACHPEANRIAPKTDRPGTSPELKAMEEFMAGSIRESGKKVQRTRMMKAKT